jgi:hypothetical protein
MSIRPALTFATLCSLLPGLTSFAHATDLTSARKREILSGIHRIAIISPFFGVDASEKPADAPPREYADELAKLLDHTGSALPKRIAARTPYEIVPAAEVSQALKELELAPARLFQGDGKMKGGRFAAPDPIAVKRLAARLHADAILLTTLDEPIKKGAQYSLDPINGLSYDSPHVSSKAAFYVDQSDGTEVLHDFVEALHPLTRGKRRSYVLADWQEATDTVVEDFLDELTRYTPAQR